jgi:hypothetical protein
MQISGQNAGIKEQVEAHPHIEAIAGNFVDGRVALQCGFNYFEKRLRASAHTNSQARLLTSGPRVGSRS